MFPFCICHNGDVTGCPFHDPEITRATTEELREASTVLADIRDFHGRQTDERTQ